MSLIEVLGQLQAHARERLDQAPDLGVAIRGESPDRTTWQVRKEAGQRTGVESGALRRGLGLVQHHHRVPGPVEREVAAQDDEPV